MNNGSQSTLIQDTHYLMACLVIAKTQPNGYYDKQCTTGAILVQSQRIISIGYDNPKTGEIAELMAISQVNGSVAGAILYTSLAPTRILDSDRLTVLINSQIVRLVYGYCYPNQQLDYGDNILQQLERGGIRCNYLRIPEILQFYAPFRFGEIRGF